MGEELKGTSGDVLAMYFVIKRRHMCQLRAKHIIVTSNETAGVAVNVAVHVLVKSDCGVKRKHAVYAAAKSIQTLHKPQQHVSVNSRHYVVNKTNTFEL